MEITKPVILIGVLVGVLFLAALLPTMVDFVQDLDKGSPYAYNVTGDNTTQLWWNFTGASRAASLWLLLPLIVVAAAALGFVKDLI